MRLSLFFFLPLLLTTWQTPFAATVDDCSKINTSDERLACFDNTSKPNKPPMSAETKGNEQKSKWEVYISTTVWDGNHDYDIFVFSDNKIPVHDGESRRASLSISCRRPNISVFFYTGDLLGGFDELGFVMYQLDREQAKGLAMDLEDSNIALGFWSPEESIPFIREMFGHDNMLVEFQDYRGNTLTMKFPIRGLEETMKPLGKACKW